MASSESPLLPDVKPKWPRKKWKRKTAATSAKPLSIIKSAAEREALEKENAFRAKEGKVSVENDRHELFRQAANRASSEAFSRLRSRPAHVPRERNPGRLRLLRFYFKFALRRARIFRNRFTFTQVFGVAIGVPAALSLVLCLFFLLGQPPRGVTPNLGLPRPPTAIELVQRIQTALATHHPDAAHAAAADLKKFYPTDPRTFVASGTVYAQEQNYDEARKAYLHALDLVRDLPPALINLGEVEFADGNYRQAANYYEQAGRKLPGNPHVLFRRYLCYSLLNDRPKTESVMRELNARPYSVEWYFTQASESYRSGNSREAQKLASAASSLFGEQATAYQETLKKLGWLK